MGTISDVGVAIKAERWAKAPKEVKAFFLKGSDKKVRMKEVGRLFIFEGIKWYTDNEEIAKVLKFLRADSESYILVEACSDYPSEDAREGGWDDNPWELRSNITIALRYEVWTKCPSSCSTRA